MISMWFYHIDTLLENSALMLDACASVLDNSAPV